MRSGLSLHWNPRSSPAPRGVLTARPGTRSITKIKPLPPSRPSTVGQPPFFVPLPWNMTYPSQPGAREEVPQRGAVRPLGLEEGSGLAEEVGSADLHVSPFPHWDPSTPRAPALLPSSPSFPSRGCGSVHLGGASEGLGASRPKTQRHRGGDREGARRGRHRDPQPVYSLPAARYPLSCCHVLGAGPRPPGHAASTSASAALPAHAVSVPQPWGPLLGRTSWGLSQRCSTPNPCPPTCKGDSKRGQGSRRGSGGA